MNAAAAFCILGDCFLVASEMDYQEAKRQESIRKELSAPVRPQRCPDQFVAKKRDGERWTFACVVAKQKGVRT